MDKKLDILADEMLDGVVGGTGIGDEPSGMQMDPDDEEKMREQHEKATPV